MSRIHSNQRTNCLSMEEEKQGLKKLKNPEVLIDYSQTLMISMKT